MLGRDGHVIPRVHLDLGGSCNGFGCAVIEIVFEHTANRHPHLMGPVGGGSAGTGVCDDVHGLHTCRVDPGADGIGLRVGIRNAYRVINAVQRQSLCDQSIDIIGCAPVKGAVKRAYLVSQVAIKWPVADGFRAPGCQRAHENCQNDETPQNRTASHDHPPLLGVRIMKQCFPSRRTVGIACLRCPNGCREYFLLKAIVGAVMMKRQGKY